MHQIRLKCKCGQMRFNALRLKSCMLMECQKCRAVYKWVDGFVETDREQYPELAAECPVCSGSGRTYRMEITATGSSVIAENCAACNATGQRQVLDYDEEGRS